MSAELGAYLRLIRRVAASYLSPFAPYGHTVSYGAHPQQRMILFVPPGRAARERTPVLFVHGGSWTSGGPAINRFVGRWLVRERPAAVCGYRLAPGSVYPAQLDDIYDAAADMLDRLAARGCRADRLVISGQSAGAHLAALGVTDRFERAPSLASRLSGLLVVSGPLDLSIVCAQPSWCPSVRALMGGDDGWDAADPAIRTTRVNALPTLALHGGADRVVHPAASRSFVQRVLHAGAPARLIELPNRYHAEMMDVFVGDSPEGREVRAWLRGFDAEREEDRL